MQTQTKTVEPLKLVPFNTLWINHDKIDVHAIYRRPRYIEDEFGEKNREYDKDGQPTWDITGALPVKQHNKWLSKGFQYVTLADRDSLVTAGRFGTIDGNWREYDQHQSGGPWNYKKYLVGQQVAQDREADQLQKDVNQYGSEIVERIRRGMDSSFKLPEHLQNIKPASELRAAAAAHARSFIGKKNEAE